MKVYQVHFGCKYEGGSTVIIYYTSEDARKYVLAKIKEDEERWRDYYKDHPNEDRGSPRLGEWTESKPNYFEGRNDIYVIVETEVKEFFEEKDLEYSESF